MAHDPEGRGIGPNGRLARLPALDGIRGLGIPLVLLYHHGQPILGVRFGGGFFTVSMFFTLSGFLITRLLVQEHHDRGTIALGSFYARRARRLMPAALTVCLAVAVMWAVFPGSSRTLGFPNVLWAILYGTNLYQIAQGNSYNDLFAERSPLLHTWSLSLEEQIYIIFPLLLVVILRSTRLRRHVALALAGLAVLSFAAAFGWTVAVSASRAYYATEARAGEFLVGAAFACFWATSPMVPRLSTFMRSRRGDVVGVALLAVAVALWWTANLQTPWFFRGGTAINALVTAGLMAYACAAPHRASSWFLSRRPLVVIGLRAYSLYLVHWPVFVFLDAESTGLSSLPLFVLRVLATCAISEVVYRTIEMRVLTSRWWPGSSLYRGCALLAAAALLVAPFAQDPKIDALIDEDALRIQQEDLARLPQITDDDPTRSAIDPTLPARVLVVGDSQSWFVGGGMDQMWGEANGVQVERSAGVGCGTAPLTRIRYLGEEFPAGRPGCREWRDFLPQILERFRPQVVVVVGGLADLSDRHVDGAWRHIGEIEYDAWLEDALQGFADEMRSQGARVLWLTHPYVNPPNPPDIAAYPEEDPVRMDRYNQLIQQLAARDPEVDTADLATFVRNRPGGEFDIIFRPDGSHMLLTEAPDVVEFIAAAIIESTADAP